MCGEVFQNMQTIGHVANNTLVHLQQQLALNSTIATHKNNHSTASRKQNINQNPYYGENNTFLMTKNKFNAGNH